MEPLDLAGGGGMSGSGQQMLDAVLAADPVEQHLGVLEPEPAGEHLAVIGEDLLGNPMATHRLGEMGAHRPAGRSDHHPCAHDEPGVVIDAREHLALAPIGQQHTTHDVHLPQLHRSGALPALEPAVTRR
jgi:hypothetical protein